nr:hypothetical protein [Tanacetum cinerariifolium]
MDVVGHPDENEEPNENEDPSDAAIDGELMDTIDPPSHESKITSPCGLEKKGDDLDGAKLIRHSKRHKHGMLSTADNGEVVNEPQLPDSNEIILDVTKPRDLKRNKKKGTLLQDFLHVIGKDGNEIKLEPWIE